MTNPLIEWLDTATLPMLDAIKAMPSGVIIADTMGTIVFWNSGAEKQFGFTSAEVVGSNLMMLIPDRYTAAHVDAMKRRRESLSQEDVSKVIGQTIELSGRRKDNTEFPIQISVVKHTLNDVLCYVAFTFDATDALRSEAMRMIEAAFSAVVNKMNTDPNPPPE